MNEGFIKKANRKSANDIQAEYDFASMKGGVRGKYVRRYRAGTNLVLLDPGLVEAFPTDAAVNKALRAVLRLSRVVEARDNARQSAGRARRLKTASS